MHSSRRVKARFVPPWEKYGFRTADEFYGGLMRSSNPLQRLNRDLQRRNDAEEAQGVHPNIDNNPTRALEASVEVDAFLPFGARPCCWNESTERGRYAAWGVCDVASDFNSKPAVHKKSCQISRFPHYKNLGQKGNWTSSGKVGLVLDIDGVVYRSGQIIPGSDVAIRTLSERRIPFVFMTNGGGCPESKKAEELSKVLNVPIDPKQILLAHTPMQHLVNSHHLTSESTILCVGPDPGSVAAMNQYGFKNAISTRTIQREFPELFPMQEWDDTVTRDERANALRQNIQMLAKDAGSPPYPTIDAICILNDTSIDLFNDIQLIIDVATAPHGKIGSRFVSAEQTVPVFMSSDDFLWPAGSVIPRFGQGAVREQISAVYECITGTALQVTQYGKPRRVAYRFAENRLREVSHALFGWESSALETVCMVGDNLETDILGANAMNDGTWLSVHVQTGVGKAPSAQRTSIPGDNEEEWLRKYFADAAPHCAAYCLNDFVLSLGNLSKEEITAGRKKLFLPSCPVTLHETYNLPLFM